MENFTHLHVHSEFSLLDGMNKIPDYVKRVKKLGMTACAITDHNHIGAWLDFDKACKDNGIKKILGCEMYYTEDTNILSLPADERNALAYEAALEDGVEIPEKINGKKITKKKINEIIEPYKYKTKQ